MLPLAEIHTNADNDKQPSQQKENIERDEEPEGKHEQSFVAVQFAHFSRIIKLVADVTDYGEDPKRA